MKPTLHGAFIDAESRGAPIHATGVVAFVTYSSDGRWMRVDGCTFYGMGCLLEAT